MIMKKTRIALIGAAIALLATFLTVFGWKRAADQPSASSQTAGQEASQSSNSASKDRTNADNIYETAEQLAEVYLEKLRESYKKYGRELSPDDAAHFRKVAADAFKEYVKEYGRKPSHSDIKFTDKPPQQESYVEIDQSALGYYKGPQTVEALMERFDDNYSKSHPKGGWVDKAFPRKEWIQRALDLGIVFRDNLDYSGILNTRGLLSRIRTHPKSYADIIRIYGLEDDAKYNAYLNKKIIRIARQNIMFRDAARKDPRSMGGIYLADRIIPTRGNQVHVKITPGDPNHAVLMYGPRDRRLTYEERHLLKYHGVAPEGIEVVYLDKNNEPMPPSSDPPRLDWKDYVAAMSPEDRKKALEEAVERWSSKEASKMTIIDWMGLADYTGALLDYTEGGRAGVPDAPPVSPVPPTPSGVAAPSEAPSAPVEQALPPLLPPGVELPKSPGKSREDVDAFFDFLDLHLIENADVPENVRRGLKQRYEAYQMWKDQDRLRRQEPAPPPPPANEDGDTSDEEDDE